LANSATLEACDPTGTLNLLNELGAIKSAAARAISTGQQTSADTSWSIWTEFCHSLSCDPFLDNIQDPLPLLQIFAERYRVGTLAPSQLKVRSRTVEGALRAVGQTFAALGRPDPRLQPSGKLDFRLSRELQGYSKADPPPHRVKPIPLQVLLHIIQHAYITPDPISNAIGHMLTLGFFFLLRPGEYASTNNPDAAPFRLCDVHLLLHQRRLDIYTCPEHELDHATHLALEFTNQKNGVRGELVGLGRSQHPILCPVSAMICRLKHLRLHNAPLTAPIYTVFAPTPTAITTSELTQRLRQACITIGATVGISADDISIRSLRSSSAMALLCADVDTDKIRLLGRWRSEEML
jgi:hypothetical protein